MSDGSAAARETADLSTIYKPSPEAIASLSSPVPTAISSFWGGLFGEHFEKFYRF